MKYCQPLIGKTNVNCVNYRDSLQLTTFFTTRRIFLHFTIVLYRVMGAIHWKHLNSGVCIPAVSWSKTGEREVAGSIPSQAIRVDSEVHYMQTTAEHRRWCIYPGFKTHKQDQLKFKTESRLKKKKFNFA